MIIFPNNGSIVTDSDVKRIRDLAYKMCLETEKHLLKSHLKGQCISRRL